MQRILLIGGSPEPSSVHTLKRIYHKWSHDDEPCVVVAVDRGFDYACAAGIEPQLFCGDCDTVSAEGLTNLMRLEAKGHCEVERYNPYKDETDLSLALSAVHRRFVEPNIMCTCFSGGRPDHFLAVLGTLSRVKGSVGLFEDRFEGRILHAGESWLLTSDDNQKTSPYSETHLSKSVLSLNPDAGTHGFSFIPLLLHTVVSLDGMEWNLDHHMCEPLSDLGVSNLVRSAPAAITVHDGCAVAFIYAAC